MSNEHEVIKVLKSVVKERRFTGTELCKATGLAWSKLRNYGVRLGTRDVVLEGMFTKLGGDFLAWKPGNDKLEEKRDYEVTYTATMNYYDYVELQEARQAAKDARTRAERAFWVAIGSVVIALGSFLGQWAIDQTVRLDAAQMTEIKASIGETATSLSEKRPVSISH